MSIYSCILEYKYSTIMHRTIEIFNNAVELFVWVFIKYLIDLFFLNMDFELNGLAGILR